MRDIHEQLENRGSRAKLKQRLVGAAVLLIVLAIFLPFIFNHSHLGASATAEQDNLSNANASASMATDNANATDQSAPQAPLNSAEQSVDSSAAQGEMAAADQTVEADEALQAIEVAAETSTAEAQSANLTASQEQTASTQAPAQAAAQAPAQAAAAQSQPQSQAQAQPQQMASAAASAPAGAPTAKPAQPAAAAHPSVQPAASGSWVVQVGSFSNPAHAQQLVNNLRHKGMHAYSRQVSPQMTRVYVGPVKTQQEAQALQTRIKTEFQLNGLALKK